MIGALPPVLLTLALSAPIGAAGALRNCGTVGGGQFPLHVEVVRGSTSCHSARRLMRGFLLQGKGREHDTESIVTAYTTLWGWKCGRGAGGGTCIRHGRSVDTARDVVSAND